MPPIVEIMPADPTGDGRAHGAALGRKHVTAHIDAMLKDPLLAETLGAMSRDALADQVMTRLQTPPDYGQYPELEDIYPERVEEIQGFAQGARCTPQEAAVHSYLTFRMEIERWHRSLQPETHCSGVFLNGPDGVLGAHSIESMPPPMPENFRHRKPAALAAARPLRPHREQLKLTKPRTGYIVNWGVTNEKGLGCFAATSCSVWMDDPIEDTWPIGPVPLLRFASTVAELETLYRRYTLHNWSRASMLFADVTGDAMVVEKSFRRIGIRRANGANVLWCTEGHFEEAEMHAFIRERRLQYLEKMGRHLGSGDMQYAADCAVRFAHLGELCHEDWGRGYDHMRRILCDHAPFPRAICRHGGPDTAAYDCSVTMGSGFSDLTHNREFMRKWVPWKKFPCQMPEVVTQYPAWPPA